MPYAPYGRGPVSMAVAGLVAVVALIVGVLMMTDHKSGRGVIFIVAAVVAAIVAMFARPRRRAAAYSKTANTDTRG